MLILILLAVGVWFYTLHRGRLFVRAYVYIMYLTAGETPDSANLKALSLGYLDATDFAPLAKQFALEFSNGKQLPIINAARKRGFLG